MKMARTSGERFGFSRAMIPKLNSVGFPPIYFGSSCDATPMYARMMYFLFTVQL